MYKVLFSHLQIKTLHKSLLTAYKHACQARHDLHVNHSENDPLAQKEPLGLIFSAAGHQWITSVYQPILVDFEPRWCFATLCADSHTPSHQASSNPARAWDWHGTLSPWLSGNIFRKKHGQKSMKHQPFMKVGCSYLLPTMSRNQCILAFRASRRQSDPHSHAVILDPFFGASAKFDGKAEAMKVQGGKFHGCYCLEDLRMLN